MERDVEREHTHTYIYIYTEREKKWKEKREGERGKIEQHGEETEERELNIDKSCTNAG